MERRTNPDTRSQTRLSAAVAALIAVAATTATARAEPWHEPFAASPQALLDLAAKSTTSAGTGVVVLLRDTRYRFDEAGRARYTDRWVFQVVTRDGASDWGNFYAGWAPWYQQRPVIRARVITPDGSVHSLDPATITENTAGQDPHVYSDRRSLEAPLPALVPGSVVEEEVVIVDHQPFFAAGAITTVGFGNTSVPVVEQRLVVEAPHRLGITPRPQLLPALHEQHRSRGGTDRWVFSAGPFDVHPDPEGWMASDLPHYPYIELSTGRSWRAVATAYATIVDQQIAAGPIEDAILAKVRAARGRKPQIAAALALLRENIRYTGLELGESSIVPWSPRQTWQRKYGDCKDQATLLVAILRKVGLPAHVALLDTGPGQDINPTLPGLGDFDHAIVYLPGTPPTWIDPTIEFARPGELPITDHDRLALVADSATTRLSRTPKTNAAANRLIERREVYLAEEGPGRVVETTVAHGWFERDYRATYRRTTDADGRERLSSWVAAEYQATTLAEYRHGDPNDLSKPFELHLEATGAERARSEESDAAIWINPYGLLQHLPDELTRTPAPNQPPRRHDLVLTLPYTYQVDYRIVVPPGFVARALPPAATVPLGPLAITTSYRSTPSGIDATLQFTTSKQRFTPAEVTAIQAAITAFGKRDLIEIDFDQAGMVALQRGEVATALRILCKLAKQHPHEALHRRQLALAFLAAGLGEVARAQAHRAVALAPQSAAAHSRLGWVLQHDEVGRRFGAGFDHAASVAAYRRAVALDPNGHIDRADLAILLEHDTAGGRYRGDLTAAIAEYRELQQRGVNSYDYNLVVALARAGRWGEVTTAAEKVGSRQVAPLLVAARAIEESVAAALRTAQTKTQTRADRDQVLTEAISFLMLAGRYSEALAAMTQVTVVDPNQRAITEQLVAKSAPPRPLRSDPRWIMQELMATVLIDEASSDQLRPLIVKRLRTAPLDLIGHFGTADRETELRLLPRSVFLEVINASVDVDVDQTRWGVRLTLQPRFNLPGGRSHLYAERAGKGFRLIPAGRDGDGPAVFGHEALSWVARGDLAGARQWLDWAVQDSFLSSSRVITAFTTLWPLGSPEPRPRIEFAAAVLAATSPAFAAEAVPVLERCPRTEATDAISCDWALHTAYLLLGRHADAVPIGRRLLTSDPGTDSLCAALTSLGGAGQWQEVEQRATAALAADADDIDALYWLARVSYARGDLAGARGHLQRAVTAAPDLPSPHNNLAWHAAVAGTADDDLLAAAERAVALTHRANSSALNTLAMVHALRGEVGPAYQAVVESMTVDQSHQPRSEDWLVIGAIARNLGLDGPASRALRKVARELGALGIADDCHVIAAKWLAELEPK